MCWVKSLFEKCPTNQYSFMDALRVLEVSDIQLVSSIFIHFPLHIFFNFNKASSLIHTDWVLILLF